MSKSVCLHSAFTCLALALLLALGGCERKVPPLPQEPLTGERAWQDYRARSEHWRTLDQDVIRAELRSLGLRQPHLPEAARRFGFDTNQPTSWYATDAGRQVADIILSFQTPSGGWSKRTHMAARKRQPGEAFGVEADYIPTFDNDATTVQMQVLARAFHATGEQAYFDAFLRGIDLILAAQYPNGGWPQSYPLVGGYHDYITFNDEVMENNLSLLYATWQAQGVYAFVPEEVRLAAHSALLRGLQLVLDAQVVVEGQRTLWGGQHHPHSLEPMQARPYEMPALATAESVSLLGFLMTLEEPSDEIIEAVHAAVDWYRAHLIRGYRWQPGDAQITPDPDAPPMWPRFAEIGSNRALFGDRDGSVHYEIGAISEERRRGYRWYTDAPNGVLRTYEYWSQRYPR